MSSAGLLRVIASVDQHSHSRKRAIKDMLARNASLLDAWLTHGVVGSLKIPMQWVDEAKVRIPLRPRFARIAVLICVRSFRRSTLWTKAMRSRPTSCTCARACTIPRTSWRCWN